MTLKQISRIYYIKKLIERDEERLYRLESKLGVGSAPISDMPRSPSPKNKIEEVVPAIADIQNAIHKRQIECLAAQIEIEQYINSIDDMQMKLILLYRFVDLMSWRQVAQKIGGGNTEDGVKKACYRFLRKSEK